MGLSQRQQSRHLNTSSTRGIKDNIQELLHKAKLRRIYEIDPHYTAVEGVAIPEAIQTKRWLLGYN